MSKFKKIFIFMMYFLIFTFCYISFVYAQSSQYSTYYNFSELLSEHNNKYGNLRNSDIKKLLQEGEKGNAEAYYTIGFMYYRGFEKKSLNLLNADFETKTIQSYEEAFKYFKKASEMGYSKASYVIAYLYYYGEGVTQNQEVANMYYKKAFDQNKSSLAKDSNNIDINELKQKANDEDPEAMYLLGKCYYNGDEVEQDDQKAFRLFKKASDKGYYKASDQLGEMYANGYGVQQDIEVSNLYFKKAQEQEERQNKSTAQNYYTSEKQDDMDYGYVVSRKSKVANSYYNKSSEQENKSTAPKYSTLTDDQGNNIGTLIRFNDLKKSAEEGNSNSQCFLGKMYLNGRGVQQDYKEALKWFKKSAEQGNREGQSALGSLFLGGIGTEVNYREAFKWFSKSAEQNYPNAQYALGGMYYYGLGVAQDYQKAFQYFKKSSDNGSYNASIMIGDMYKDGIGLEKNITIAQNYYQKAKEQKQYENNENEKIFIKDSKKSNGIIKQNTNSHSNIISLDQFITKIKSSAEQGDSEAQFMLGVMYHNGEGVKQDFKESFKWFKKSALQNNKYAECNLGAMYALGQGVKIDATNAIKWLNKSGEDGYTPAYYNLGMIYKYGEIINQDGNKSIFYFKKHDDPKSCYEIGDVYYRGIGGVSKDYKSALSWFKKSNDSISSYFISKIYQKGGFGIQQDNDKSQEWINKYLIKRSRVPLDNRYKEWDNKYIQKYNEQESYFNNHINTKFAEYKEFNKNILKELLNVLNISSNNGDSEAQYWLANIYSNGDIIEKNYTKALELYTKSAKHGNDKSQTNLGKIYLFDKNDGTLDIVNGEEAIYWFKKAAENGNVEGQFNLAWMYGYYDNFNNNPRVEKNIKKAFEWMMKSANNEYSRSQRWLGMMYERGEGCQKDLNKALYWYKKAYENGAVFSKEDYERLKKKVGNSSSTQTVNYTNQRSTDY